MAYPRLASVVGEPAEASSPDERAQNILDSLKYGFNQGFECGTPSVTAKHWGRVQILERWSPEEGAPPFERLTSSLAGITTFTELALVGVDGELGLLLGFAGADELERARLLLAPGIRIVPSSPPTVAFRHAVGVTHRPQGEVLDSSEQALGDALIDRLDGIGGRWTLFIRCESVSMLDVLNTRYRLDALATEASSYVEMTSQVSETMTTRAVSHRWTRVQDWTGVIARLISQGMGVGLWTVDTWASSDDDITAHLVAGALHTAIPSDQGRCYETLSFDDTKPGAPPPTSVLTSRDIGWLLAPPRSGKPGLAVRPAPPGGRRPCTSGARVSIGTYEGTNVAASIGVSDFEGHAFVTGTTGSGKSTTVHKLLADMWNQHRIPFLVLDPVKDDYSEVSAHFSGGLQVVRGADLHLNLLEAWPGENSRDHIARVASAFRGAFSMPSPTPYVVTQLFDRVAMLPSEGAGMSLFDVRDMVPSLISSLGYAPEQESNIRAALMTRLNLLLAPTRAHRFSWPDSSMVDRLFTQPTVVTLSDLADDEERSFVVLLLTLATWARARNRTVTRPVEHLLVLEEAHRILPEVNEHIADQESGSARQVSAAMLSAMMAEVRSYGEQIIVIDQSPSRVSSDVSRNTNLKIVHRIVHPEDQRQVAGVLGLSQDNSPLIGLLERGEVICTTRKEPSAQTISVSALPRRPFGVDAWTPSPPPTLWPCGCSQAEIHFRAWLMADRAAPPMSLFLAGVFWGEGDGRKLRQYVYRELIAVADGSQAITDCLAWAGLRQLTTMRRMVGPASGPNSAESQLEAMYQVWEGRLPLTIHSADPILARIQGQGTTGGQERPSWEEQAIANALLSVEPRNGLKLLRGASWRSALPDLVDYLKGRKAFFEPLLGEGVIPFLANQVREAVVSSNLTPDVMDFLLARAGLLAQKTN